MSSNRNASWKKALSMTGLLLGTVAVAAWMTLGSELFTPSKPAVAFVGDSLTVLMAKEGALPEYPLAGIGSGGTDGFNGYTIKKVRETLAAKYNSHPRPDVVCIQLGTNDVNEKHSPEQIAKDMGDLIDWTHQKWKSAKVYVASIPPMLHGNPRLAAPYIPHDDVAPIIDKANVLLAQEVPKHDAIFVSRWPKGEIEDADWKFDGIHYHASGLRKLKARWDEALDYYYGYPQP